RLGRTDSLSSAQGAHEIVNEIELPHEETCPKTPIDRKKEYKRTLRMKRMQDPLTTPENTMESLVGFEPDTAANIVERKERQPGGIQPESHRLNGFDTSIDIKKPPFKHKPPSEHTLTITEPCVYKEQMDETRSEEDDTKGQQTTSEGSSENSADLLAREALGGTRITEGTRQPVIRINEFDAQHIPGLYFGPRRDLSSGETHVPPITARPPSPQASHGFEDGTDSDLTEPRKLCCFKKEPLTKRGDTTAPHGAPMAATLPGARVTQKDLPLMQKYDNGRITGKRTHSDFSRRGCSDCFGKNIPTKRTSVDVPLRSPVATTTAQVNRASKGPSPSQKHHVKQTTELNSYPLDMDQPVALLSPRPVPYVQRKQVTPKPTEKDTSPASNFIENTTDVADSNFDGIPEYKRVNNSKELQKPSKAYDQYFPEADALPRRLDLYRDDPKLFPGLDWCDDDSMQERFPVFLSLEEDYFGQLDELESVKTPQTVRTSICDNELLQAKINPRIHARLAAPRKAQHKGRMMQDISSASESTSGILVSARPFCWETVNPTVINDASEIIDRSGTHQSADSPANSGLWQRELEEASEQLGNQHDDHPPTKTSGPSLQRLAEKCQFVSRYTQTDHVCITECKCREMGIVSSNEGSSNEVELAVGEQSKPVRYNVETNYNARLKPQSKSNKGSAGSTDGRLKQNQPTSNNETVVPVASVSPSSQKVADQTEVCTDSDLTGPRKLWCFSTNKPTKRTSKDVPMDHKETDIPDGLSLLQKDRTKQSDQMMQEQPTVPSGPSHKGHRLGETPRKRESHHTDLNLTLGSVHSIKKPEMPNEVEAYQTYPRVTPRLNLFHDDGMQDGYPKRISRYTQADFGCIANCGCTKQGPGAPNLGCMENTKSDLEKKTKNIVHQPDRIKNDVTQIAEERVTNPLSKTYESYQHGSSNLRRASRSTNRKQDTAPPEGQSLQRRSSSRKQPPVPAAQQQRTSTKTPNKTVDRVEQRRESQKKVIRHPINSKTITDAPVLSADSIKKPFGSMKETSALAVTNEAANLIHNSVSPFANTAPITVEDVRAMNRTDDLNVCPLHLKLNESAFKAPENVLQHRSPSQDITKDGPRDPRTSVQTRSPVSSTVRATGCLPFLSKLTSCNPTSQRNNPKVDISNTARQSAALTSAASTQKADFFFDTNDGQLLASISLDENAEKLYHLKHQLPMQAFSSDRMNPQNKLSFNSTSRVKIDVGHQTAGVSTNQIKMSPSQPTVPGVNDDQKHEANSHVAATRNEHRESAVQLDGSSTEPSTPTSLAVATFSGTKLICSEGS
ncbi:hypothetical protein X801_04467, partial [Opisthorchis viverrini]